MYDCDLSLPVRISEFLSAFVRWAAGQPDIQGVSLLGSYARGQAREDSDVDLVLVTLAPQCYLRQTTWVRRFGRVQREQLEDWGLVTSLRVWYEDSLEVEFGLTTPAWSQIPVDEETRRVVADGMVVLLDRDGSLNTLRLAVNP